ncbi:XRE family transcriptional regulator [Actinomadura sp. DC4]|uniref:ATP-binding protein n=1 Tax=Actinomadura sp. DC4 TaxID=3055069 RepID=UPI0025AF2F92|nr:XRE family transcriptional regulator [Actinomadura sp. DC4]MDN3358578.1 helix-turn-helix domain-containing protein [Actinomadura sp. DC4]
MADAGAFGELLRRHRHAAALTIEDLSAASGVSVRAIGDMERGRSRGPQRRTVAALADALGLPSPDREAIEVAARAGRPRTGTAPSGGGCELPRRVGDFTGRRAELDWLERLAAKAGDDGPATIATISGGPGMGKSALVVHAAVQLAPYFPDGSLFVDLRGMDAAPVAAGAALSRLLKAFGVAEGRIPHDEEERAGLYRSLLADRRSLIVLDNAADEAQVRSLLPGGGGSLVLVTSRRSLAGLEGVHQLPLAGMPPGDAVQMLRGIVGEGRQGDGDLDVVAELCGNLPLAMRIAGNRLLSRPGWTAGHLAGRLADEERRLDLLSAGDLHVGAAFALSYRHLSARAAELFRRLGLVPGPDFGAAMGTLLTGGSLDDAEDALEELVDLGLLQAPYLGRYRLHDLVRLYARARLADEEPETREAVRRRMNDWLLDVTVVAGRWFEPAYGEPPADYDGLVPLDTRDEAHVWLEGESANWLAALRSAAAEGRHARVVEVAGAMHWFSDRLVHWGVWREVFELSSGAANAVGDRRAEAVHLNYLAWALSYCEGRHQEGVDCALRAYELARELGDLSEQAWALQYAGLALRGIPGSNERVAAYARDAVALFSTAGDWDGYYQGMGAVGDSLRRLGRTDEALRHLNALVGELRDPEGKGTAYLREATMGRTLARIAACHVADGDWLAAATTLRTCLPLVREHGSVVEVADRCYELGQALHELGDIPATRAALEEALAGYRSLGDERAETVTKELASLDG